ncbi:MAG: hypothetical protein A2958_00900 [Candidatus Levybacteria bacterium RIFCSPLOWO2_01_FULL_38_13]|nr:MAG: hypothetical protein A2629_00795 [Candidatus Levybacteria bacterium RIFCSPHIGHO2_01_FULL_41_15]OGH34845.1 MAG: hypothetical protein A2958_00900 [Candidatus Levybacteria bacterium RIFCSPLOWO2_01_FULL_38_13]
MKVFHTLYLKIISIENLFQAWDEFKKDKRRKKDVRFFEINLEDNLFGLHKKLKSGNYRHGKYTAFNIYDPKFRHIHKAQVRDRIVHHAIVSILEPIFDQIFIYDSYSCRLNKGTHRAVKRLSKLIRKVSKNYKQDCFVLKLDIKKFFESVDHAILLSIIKRKIKDGNLTWLLENILKSFSKERGIPIGNLTSQLFANIYLNELDQFVKQKLKVKYYIRYADDFIILDPDLKKLSKYISIITMFLRDNLNLDLHSKKIIIRKYNQGIDFLGYIVLPHHILPCTKTRNRIFKKIENKIEDFRSGKILQYSLNQSIAAYLGFLNHADSYRLTQKIKKELQFLKSD